MLHEFHLINFLPCVFSSSSSLLLPFFDGGGGVGGRWWWSQIAGRRSVRKV